MNRDKQPYSTSCSPHSSGRHLGMYNGKGRFLVLCSSKATSSKLLKPLYRSFQQSCPRFHSKLSRVRKVSTFSLLIVTLLCIWIHRPDTQQRKTLAVDVFNLHLDSGPVRLAVCVSKCGMRWILMLNLWHMEPAMFFVICREKWGAARLTLNAALWPSVFPTQQSCIMYVKLCYMVNYYSKE